MRGFRRVTIKSSGQNGLRCQNIIYGQWRINGLHHDVMKYEVVVLLKRGSGVGLKQTKNSEEMICAIMTHKDRKSLRNKFFIPQLILLIYIYIYILQQQMLYNFRYYKKVMRDQ